MKYVFTHKAPDADAFGSAIALARMINGKAVFLAEDLYQAPRTIQKIFSWHPELLTENVLVATEPGDSVQQIGSSFWHTEDEVWVVDCGDPDRINWCGITATPVPVRVSVDHHGTAKVGSFELVYNDAASTAEILKLRYSRLPGSIEIDQIVDELLFAAHMGDTCWLSVGVTQAAASVYSELVADLGEDVVAELSEAYHTVSVKRKMVLEAITESMVIKDSIAVATFTNAARERIQPAKYDMAGIANELLMTEGVEAVCLNLQDQKTGTWQYQFRSKKSVDGQALAWAQTHGGAGHPNAAGGKGDTLLTIDDLQLTVETAS